MFDKFFPDEYLASAYVIPFEELYEKGYRESSLISTIHWYHTEHRQMKGQKAVYAFKQNRIFLLPSVK